MIVFLVAQGNNTYNRYAGQFRVNFLGIINLMFLLLARITTIMYDFFFLPVLIIRFQFVFFFVFFLSSLLDYRFPYCIQLYTWSTQQVIVA